MDNERELEYARKSIYSELRNRKDLDLVIVLGDIVNEKTDLIRPSEQMLDSTGIKWFRVNGNHDGPFPVKDTSVTLRHTCFILMDNVRRTRKGGYNGGFSEAQKEWLRHQLDKTPINDRVVLCTHIPISQSRGLDSIANILATRENVLFVSGHTHNIDRHIIERGTEELIAGASCGTWWRGVKDGDGVPYALMNCGAPRGYFIADFKTGEGKRRPGDWYRLSYKAIGREDSASARVDDGTLFLNVFGGSREGTLTLCVGGKRFKMQHRYCVAPEVRDVIETNSRVGREYRRAHKDEFMPLRNLASPHIWALELDPNTEARLRQTGECKFHYRDRNMKIDEKLLISFSIQ